jgi:hypothetical protein
MNQQTGLEQFAPTTDLELDAGIRRAVLVLRSAGIETFESCAGDAGHAFPKNFVIREGGRIRAKVLRGEDETLGKFCLS